MSLMLSPISDFVHKVRSVSKTAMRPEDEFFYIDLSAVDKEEKHVIREAAKWLTWAEAPSRARQIVQANDILVSTVRPNLNGVAQLGVDHDGAIASTGFCVLRANPDVLDSRYLFHWVCSPKFVTEMVKQATGASYPAVSDRIILESLIPIAGDVNEQRRIAVTLDKANAICKKRREALKLTDEFLRSVFLDMFGDPITNPKGWPKARLGSVTTKIGSGATPLGGDSVYKTSGISFIRSLNVHDRRFVLKDLACLDQAQAARLANVDVLPGDVLLNITGASVARCCLVPNEVLPARVNQHVSIVRPNGLLVSEFLEAQLVGESVKGVLLGIGESMGATRQAITKAQLESFSVIVPPVPEQRRFADIVAKVGKQKQEMQEFAIQSELLFDALQQEAFS